jgi:hypothetical protein
MPMSTCEALTATESMYGLHLISVISLRRDRTSMPVFTHGEYKNDD